jgi:hypothetical protein
MLQYAGIRLARVWSVNNLPIIAPPRSHRSKVRVPRLFIVFVSRRQSESENLGPRTLILRGRWLLELGSLRVQCARHVEARENIRPLIESPNNGVDAGGNG